MFANVKVLFLLCCGSKTFLWFNIPLVTETGRRALRWESRLSTGQTVSRWQVGHFFSPWMWKLRNLRRSVFPCIDCSALWVLMPYWKNLFTYKCDWQSHIFFSIASIYWRFACVVWEMVSFQPRKKRLFDWKWRRWSKVKPGGAVHTNI